MVETWDPSTDKQWDVMWAVSLVASWVAPKAALMVLQRAAR